MRRNIWWSVICICLFALTGCGQKTESAESSELTEYVESSLIFRLPKEQYYLMGMSNTHFYYNYRDVISIDDKEYTEELSIYMQSLEKGSESVKLDLPSDNPLLRSSYITTNSTTGMDNIYLLLGEGKEEELSYSLVGYDTEGNFLEKVPLKDTDLYRDYPNAFVKLQDGKFAVITKKYFFVVDSSGETLYSILCPGVEYRGLIEISDDKIGVSYVESDGKTVVLSVIDRNTRNMSQGTPISGDGNYLCMHQKAIAYVDEKGIYEYDLTDKIVTEMVNLEGRNIDIHQIVDIKAKEDTFYLLGNSTIGNAVKYITYNKQLGKNIKEVEETSELDPNKYDAYGRRYIYLYDYSGDWSKEDTIIVDAFNEQSNAYQVLFKDYQYASTYDVAKIVASGDYPDLILSNYNTLIAEFNEKGVLEDLTPYINDSKNLAIDDLSETILNAYTNQGKLFALPNKYTLKAFWGDKETLGNAGWTVDEFLDWLTEHPNAYGAICTTKQIYDACIPAIMKMCIDRETGKANFNSEIFQSFMTKMKVLNRKDSYTYEEMQEMIGKEDAYYLSYDIDLSTIAVEENKQGREMVIKGSPSADEKPVAYINSPALSILSTSEVKEGAYEFLEFYLLYMNDDMIRLMNKNGFSKLWTVERYLELNIDALLQADKYVEEPCTFSKSQLDAVLNLIPDAELMDYSQYDLEELIWEELEPFLLNQKDADTVCEIIQNRVQLYLDEK
ncbi:MAG TPA: extracellular solute-binding protein [Lachnospiraceae bacterium]|nr:extracellular solute-binding protein [Lachnospiraceae bacterium]